MIRKTHLVLFRIFLLLFGIRANYIDETLLSLDEEFCQDEFFNPRCPQGELVLIESAKYGRMNIGKCIKEQELISMGTNSKDQKYFGCFTDVTAILHKKCSFKMGCNVEVKDRELNHTTSCHSWVKSHLKVNHQCLNAIQNDDNCRIMASQKPMHLILGGASPDKCGTRNNPWMAEAFKGQRIKISQLKFSDNSQQHPLICSGIGVTVTDRKANKNVTICQDHPTGLGTIEVSHVYSSKGGAVEIVNFQTNDESSKTEMPNRLLLKIEVDGCTDIIPPEDKWLKRTNDEIVIGCYSSKQTWFLQCEHGKWTGTFGNCSDRNSDSTGLSVKIEKSNRVNGMSEENQVLVIIAISAFGLVICLLIMCCGAMIVRRFKNEKPLNLMARESYYGKDGTNNQSHYGPMAYSTLNGQTAKKVADKQSNEAEEQKYFVLDENMIEKSNQN